MLLSAAVLNKACVPGRKAMWTHLELSGCITKDRKPGPNMGLNATTPKTLLQVLDSLSCLALRWSLWVWRTWHARWWMSSNSFSSVNTNAILQLHIVFSNFIIQVTMSSLGLTWQRRTRRQRFSLKPYYPALTALWVCIGACSIFHFEAFLQKRWVASWQAEKMHIDIVINFVEGM